MSDDLTLEKINAERITNLEKKFDQFARDIRSDIQGLTTHLDDKIDRMFEHRQGAGLLSRVTNGKNGANGRWITGVVAVVGIIGTLWVPLSQQVSGTVAALKEHGRIDGHAPVLRSLGELSTDVAHLKSGQEKTNARIESSIAQLDQSLQREMRDLDEATHTEIQNLDATLQREIQQAEKLVASKIDPVIAGLNAAAADLASRKGKRFNMPDYDRLVQPQFQEIMYRMERLEERLLEEQLNAP